MKGSTAPKVILVNIDRIKPYKNNPRNNDAAVEKVAESITLFGFKNPILLDTKNVIVCGHTRLKAAQKLGMEQVPCIIATDLTPKQIKAYRLIDNKVAELAQWDLGLLNEELTALKLDMPDIDFDGFGLVLGNMDEDGIQDFFENSTERGEKKPKTVKCPKCGEEFEP